jgi:hypothetical protein
MHIWIAFDARDPLGEKFTHIKEYLGVSSKAEVQRSEAGTAGLAALYEMYNTKTSIVTTNRISAYRNQFIRRIFAPHCSKQR